MKKLIPRVLAVTLLCGIAYPQTIETHAKEGDWEEINFEFNQAVLTDGFPSLLRLSSLLQEHPDYKLVLTGNADQIGSARANDALSLRRAQAVSAFLQKYGARANQIETKGDGKRNPAVASQDRNARFVNRRVTIQVTTPDGRQIGDGSIAEAIRALETFTRTQLGKIDGMLTQLQNLQQQLQTLRTEITSATQPIKEDTAAIRQDTGTLKQDTAALREDTRNLVARPSPLTEQETTRIARSAADYALTETALRNRKYSLVGIGAGPGFGGGRIGSYSASLFGKALIPFGNGKVREDDGTHALLLEGDWTYFHRRARGPDGRNEGTMNVGLVNRFKHVQLGTIAQFDAVNITGYHGGAWLGAGVVTVDYVGKFGTLGIFGAKGFHPESPISRLSTGPLPVPAYIRYNDQLGAQGTIGLGHNLELHAAAAWKKVYQSGDGFAADARLTWWMAHNVGLFAMGESNPGLQNRVTGNRIIFGVNFGNWMRATDYGSTTGVVPVTVPGARYEVLPR